jgi:Putative Ig domain/Right handed beta helix region
MFPLSSPQRQSAVQTVYVLTVLISFAFLTSSYSYAQSSVFLEAYAPAGAVSTPYNTTLTARGGTAPYTFSASGLPAGLTLNATTGLISGTPLTAGTSSVSATVSDANAEHAYLTFSILISKSGTVSVTVKPETAALLSGLTKQFSAKVFNSSNQSVTWSCTSGTITSTGLYTAPTVDSGTWTYRVTATSVASPSRSGGTIVEVSPNIPPLKITTTSLPQFMTGDAYSQTVNVTGGKTPYHWKMTSGTMPSGITLTKPTGAISGVSSQTGPFPFTIQVTDSSWPTNLTATQSYTLVGSSALIVTTPVLPQITAGENYDTSVAVVGGVTPYQWSISSGSLPTGISLNAGTGVISGTTEQTGQYKLSVKVTDSSSPHQSAFQSYTVQAVSGQSSAADFYVSPSGKDTWSGTLAAPNSGNTDGPFASIGRAQTAVQGILKNPKGRTKPIQVLVRAGTYYVAQPLSFTSADSGTPSLAVNWANYPDEAPVISGGMRITNWKKSGSQWVATLPSGTQYFEQLFYNGQRRLRPRLGGSLGTYYRIAATVYLPGSSGGPPPDPNCSVYMTGKGWECFDRFVYTATDPISNNWQNLNSPYPQGDIELYLFERWDASKLRVKSIDTSAHIIYLTGPTDQMDSFHGMIPGHRYLVENLKDDFNQPGQWFLDRSKTSWTLNYLPNSNENPPTDTVIIPQATQVMTATGLEYVTFQGLTFEHDNWTVPSPLGYPSTTGDQNVSAAVGCYNCSYVTLDGVTVRQTSGGGVEFFTNSTSSTTAHNTIKNSAIYDVGANGIRYGLLAYYTDTDTNVAQFGTIENNVIAGFGRVLPGTEAIYQGDGHDNLYTHNDIYDGYHGGIHVCSLTCPPGSKSSHGAYNNVVSFNHIYNLGQGILSDFGGIYFNTDPTATGNQVLNNKVHDISDDSALDTDGYAGQGIYVDDSTANMLVQNNLVYRASSSLNAQTCGPQTPGTPNNFVNNIFAYGRIGTKQEGCAPPASGVLQFNFTNNLVYFDRGRVEYGALDCSGSNCPQVQMYANNMYCYVPGAACAPPANIFYTTDSTGKYGSGQSFTTFSAWQSGTGEDKGSLVQDPGFAHPAFPDDDYTLNESPGVGFVVFDPNQAGRSNPVIPSPTVEATFPTAPFNPATDF